jgi:hypothetical protein
MHSIAAHRADPDLRLSYQAHRRLTGVATSHGAVTGVWPWRVSGQRGRTRGPQSRSVAILGSLGLRSKILTNETNCTPIGYCSHVPLQKSTFFQVPMARDPHPLDRIILSMLEVVPQESAKTSSDSQGGQDAQVVCLNAKMFRLNSASEVS